MSKIKRIDSKSDHWVERWAVGSMTSDKEYTVAADRFGNYGCTCPAYKFQRKKMRKSNPEWNCKHIHAVVTWRGMATRTASPETKIVVGTETVRMIDINDLD